MTDQSELDRLLGAFFADGTDELADRVIDAALHQIDHTHQRRGSPLPRRIPTMTMPIRLAAAAVIGALAVGGALYLTGPREPAVGGPSPTPTQLLSAAPSASFIPVGSGLWTATGNMSAARTYHTATLLLGGKVLVAGGENSASAELYDAGRRSWSATGMMLVAHGDHTATLLRDGRVLVAGGGDGNGHSNDSAEVYDPSSGSWIATGSMRAGRTDHTATLLPNGRVLVAGGFDIGSAELYDPNLGSWITAGNMAHIRAYHTATLLRDGKVLVAGGFGAGASAELYDPSTGAWTATGSMGDDRAGHTATLLPDGKVLVAGGSTSGGSFHPTASAELYDPSTGTWTVIGNMSAPRVYATATLLPDGRVLVTGGSSVFDNNQVREVLPAELYDPSRGSWTTTATMSERRVYHTATLLGDGQVLVAGGKDKPVLGSTWSSAELYDPGSGN